MILAGKRFPVQNIPLIDFLLGSGKRRMFSDLPITMEWFPFANGSDRCLNPGDGRVTPPLYRQLV
jgi:hypothetical protein